MHEAGVPLVLGTDVIGIPGVVPGFSLHAEFAELRAAGLSPYVVLAAGTRNAGVLLRKMRPAEQVGVIAVGWRADLVLLDGNPLNDLETLRRPVAVVAAGRVYPGSWLTAQLVRLREER
jgi:imidazolonepropionase-like amidohydrolase